MGVGGGGGGRVGMGVGGGGGGRVGMGVGGGGGGRGCVTGGGLWKSGQPSLVMNREETKRRRREKKCQLTCLSDRVEGYPNARLFWNIPEKSFSLQIG